MEGEGWSLIRREWDLETGVETKNHKEEVLDMKNVIAENNAILASLKQLIEDKLNG